MSALDTAKRVAQLMPGKSIRVSGADGKTYRLTLEGDEASAPDADPSAEKAVAVDEQLRVTLSIVSGLAVRLDEMMARAEKAIERMDSAAEGQGRFAESANNLAAVLESQRFSQPIYNEQGKLIGAKRVKQLEG